VSFGSQAVSQNVFDIHIKINLLQTSTNSGHVNSETH
jgi:hypothetical protein